MKNSILISILFLSFAIVYSCKPPGDKKDAPAEQRASNTAKTGSGSCSPTDDKSVEETATSAPNRDSDLATSEAEEAATRKAGRACKGACNPSTEHCAFFKQGIKTVTVTTQVTVDNVTTPNYTATSTVTGKCGCE